MSNLSESSKRRAWKRIKAKWLGLPWWDLTLGPKTSGFFSENRKPEMTDYYILAVLRVALQWLKSGWNSGGRRVDPEGVMGRGMGCGGYPSHWICPFPRKKWILTWNGVFWCILSGTFCPCPCQKNVNTERKSMPAAFSFVGKHAPGQSISVPRLKRRGCKGVFFSWRSYCQKASWSLSYRR